MTINFYKSQELTGSSFVETPVRSWAILCIQNDDIYYSIWSILAHLHLIKDRKCGHPARVPYYNQCFNKLNNERFDFILGFKTFDVQRL